MLKADGKKHAVFLSRWLGFPNGLAATQRVLLIARALLENGIDVTVLCIGPSERPPTIYNHESVGQHCGINFKYTSGCTVRSRYFLGRRYYELKGILVGILILIKFKFKNCLDYIYLYSTADQFNFIHIIFSHLARLLNVKLIIEINELPWSFIKSSYFKSNISPLKYVNGTVVISDYLSAWVSQEIQKLNYNSKIMKMPILVDIYEQKLESKCSNASCVMFAGSPNSEKTIDFILDSMSIVWKLLPSCKLIITGLKPDDQDNKWLLEEIEYRSIGSFIEGVGYLSRTDLLRKYSEAAVLLIPLFEDPRSHARFPTKIGEYLASGRPVITNKVGEVECYLEDGINAFLCEPGDIRQYANKIIEVLGNPENSEIVGMRGRQLAIENFHYALYGEKLRIFFNSL